MGKGKVNINSEPVIVEANLKSKPSAEATEFQFGH